MECHLAFSHHLHLHAVRPQEDLCPRVPPEHGKAVNEDIQLIRGLTTPAVDAFGLEHEHRRIKAELDAFAEEKGKLEDEIRQVKESLKAREKDLAHKDANLQ